MAAISSTVIKQLKSSSARQRYEAIKQIARAKDDSSSTLRLLTDMARNDPDPQVQAVAQKAVNYLKGVSARSETAAGGEGGSYLDYEGGKEKPKKRELTEGDLALAKSLVEEGLSYQMSGEINKSLKSLSRALAINPNLREDPYFRSVLDSTTGLAGEESLELLANQTERRNIATAERQLKNEKRKQSHREKVDRTTWASASMDLVLFFIIVTGGFILTLLVMGESARMLVNNYVPGGDVDPSLYRQAREWQSISFGPAIIGGAMAGFSALISMLIQLAVTHVVARFAFGGIATLPHLIYKVVSFYNSRLVVIYGLTIVMLFLTFGLGVPIFAALVGAGLAIYNLIMALKIIGTIGETYDFGFLRGCLSVLVGGIILSLIASAITFFLTGSILAALMAMTGGGF